jgi:hypothetical protein
MVASITVVGMADIMNITMTVAANIGMVVVAAITGEGGNTLSDFRHYCTAQV